MSNFKERLKATQGSGSSYPKLPIVATIELKEDEGETVFQTYDKDSKTQVNYPAPIEGIYIGAAMQASAYSDNLGRNGGQYKSDFYVRNNNIALFAPTAKGYEVVCKGDIEVIEAYLTSVGAPKAKKRQALFVLTTEGLVAVVTNLSIAIDQLTASKTALEENLIVLTPVLYSEDNPKITKKGKEYLGKFRTKNPPKFADISIGAPITEEIWENIGTDAVIDQFVAWKKFKEEGGETKEEVKEEPQQGATWTPKSKEQQEAEMAQGKQYLKAEDDDLPF
jgi:hypothetical protein